MLLLVILAFIVLISYSLMKFIVVVFVLGGGERVLVVTGYNYVFFFRSKCYHFNYCFLKFSPCFPPLVIMKILVTHNGGAGN